MAARKLFSEWYGYDKKAPKEVNKYKNYDLGIYNRQNYYSYSLSEKIADYIKNSKFTDDQKNLILARYAPASDGITDEDFISWIEGNDQNAIRTKYPYSLWRTISIIEEHSDLVVVPLQRELNDFFKSGSTRSELIFRIIEINEFLHRGTAGETFEEFLTNNTEYAENCEKLLFKKYSPVSETLIDYRTPEFMSFGPKVSLKARKLLLELKYEDFVKVMDYNKNPLMSANNSKATTYEFLKLFIDTALGKVTRLEVKELSPKEISNHIVLAYMAGADKLWKQADTNKNIMSMTAEVIKELQRISFHGENFKRHFAHLINTGALKELTSIEVVAVVLGYDKSARWAVLQKGKSELEIITELMIDGKLDPTFISKAIAHVIINQTNLIRVDDDYDWGAAAEMPISWAIETLPTSHKKSPLVYPAIIKMLNSP